MNTLQQRDKECLWHAYTQHKTSSNPIAIVKAKDALVWDEHGKQYIDAIASWWVNPLGHSNERLAKAVYKQLTNLEHILFGGFTHLPAIELAEKLLSILPQNQKKVFFSDNGSTAVEVALKMCLQFHFNKGNSKNVLVAFEEAFHGDTFGAMAVSGISLYTQAFQGQLLKVIRIPVPTKGNEEKTKQKLIQIIENEQVAGFIFEPLVLGAAGMKMYSAKILDDLISLCKTHNIITIADEVMTGFGKTGSLFACDFLTQQPDIVCLSKALTGGTIPLAATTTSQEIFDAFYHDQTDKALFHGHTFMANPTGCAVALESIKMLQEPSTEKNLKRIHQKHQEFAQKMKLHSKVKSVRVMGVIFALDLNVKNTKSDYYGEIRNLLYNFFIENGIILRPVYHTIYVLPCYVITDEQLQKVYDTIEKAIQMLEEKNIL